MTDVTKTRMAVFAFSGAIGAGIESFAEDHGITLIPQNGWFIAHREITRYPAAKIAQARAHPRYIGDNLPGGSPIKAAAGMAGVEIHERHLDRETGTLGPLIRTTIAHGDGYTPPAAEVPP